MGEQFVSIDLEDILVGEPLPGPIYIVIEFRFITFRAQDDIIDRVAFDRLQFKKVNKLFVRDEDRAAFQEWSQSQRFEPPSPVPPGYEDFTRVRDEAERKMMDIFQSEHPDKIVSQTITVSKKLVDEVMKFPFAVQTLAQLQRFSRGTVDHSVNVSILSVYLAMQMGYTHAVILQHVGMGGLLHDIGKTKIQINDEDSEDIIRQKMMKHPEVGAALVDADSKLPKEVKLIILQHHECHDGSGYPQRLRGSKIYDLARIVSVANTFDELVCKAQGDLRARQAEAVRQLDEYLRPKFDSQKLEKILKILRLGV